MYVSCTAELSLQTQPEVFRVIGAEAVPVVVPDAVQLTDIPPPVSVVDPGQVPVEAARYIAMHPYDPVRDGNHWKRALCGNREGNGLVRNLEICVSPFHTLNIITLPTGLLRCIIGSTPILWFGTRASNALWAEGAVMYSSPQLFCF